MRLSIPNPAALCVAILMGISGTGSAANTLNDLPELTLPTAAQGDKALNAIGNRLPDWAATYDMSVHEFATTLREDPHAFLDNRGRLYFTEPDADQMPSATADLISSALYPLSQTFLLESRPGAALTIYLDFDGHRIEGTAWNANGNTSGTGPIDALPWSRDSDRGSFNDTELADIQTVWRRVAEDFAPFDVNVTTRYPGEAALVRDSTSDPYFGTRVLITPNTFYSCSCGGVAYVGTFDYQGSDYYQPALVFNGGAAAIAEAASHEAGHNLGLSHDGTSTTGYYQGHGSGETGWAPIMGVGYYRSLVQWSRGEYADASQSQDDYVVMHNNRLPFAADDHGNSIASATAANVSGDGVSASFVAAGVIERPADVDAFQFTAGAGALWVSASPVARSPNLDVGLTLVNSDGVTVAQSNSVDTLATDLQVTIAPGQYTLLVEGVGKGDPLGLGYTDYGSLGGFRVSAQFSDGSGLTPPTAVISSDYVPGYAPLIVSVDGSASTDASSYAWDFGDGSTATGVTATRTYTRPGSYNLTLLVTDANGLTDSSSQIIDVINQAPFASGSVDTTSGEAPLTVTVSSNGSSDPDGEIVQVRWDFGDGATGQGSTASHSFTAAGEFPITVTVIDDLGAEASAEVARITVTLSPVVDSVSTGDSSIAGTATGTYLDSHSADGRVQIITEQASGGRKSERYSYAEHRWLVPVPSGSSVVRVFGRQPNSNDGDGFRLTWSVASQSGLIGELDTADRWIESAPFVHSAGEVVVTLTDTDRSAGALSLDSAYIDALVINTDTTADVGDNSGGGGSNTGSLTLTLDGAYKIKGSNQVAMSWLADGSVYELRRDGVVIAQTSDTQYLDDTLGKGGMTVTYQVCNELSRCSNSLTVAF